MKYRTPTEYKEMVRTMPVKELVGLAETFNQSTTLTAGEKTIQNILNAEVERRIYNWELTEV